MSAISFHIELYQVISSLFALMAYGGVVVLTRKKVRYSKTLYIGFLLWAVLHLIGIGVYLDQSPMYSHIVLHLSDTLPILRFDQLVHMLGFGMATLLVYELSAKSFKKGTTAVLFIVVLAGLGIGAINEIVEFIISQAVDTTNIGDYQNTSLDLIADLAGALLVLPIIYKRNKR